MKRERWWGDAREEGVLVSRDNRRRGANQPRIRKAASWCSRVVCVASRVSRVTEIPKVKKRVRVVYHLYYIRSTSQRNRLVVSLYSPPPSIPIILRD